MLQPGQQAPPMAVRPIFGQPIIVPPARPLVLCFVRYLGCAFARASLARLQRAYADFDRAGVLLAAITDSPLQPAQDFVPRRQLLFPLISDASGQLAGAYGVQRDRYLLGTLRSLPRHGGDLLRSLSEGHGRPGGCERRLPAQFVVGTNGEVLLATYARSVAQLPEPKALLQCAQAS